MLTLMVVPVVRVREMRMSVGQRLMTVPMAVFCASGYWVIMCVLVMLIVDMRVTVFHRLMRVWVFMVLGEV